MNEFAIRMRKAMDLRNIQQVDLVEKTKIGKSAISQYLSGKFVPKQRATYLIAQALGVNEAWLMGHDVDIEKESIVHKKELSEDETKLLELYRRLNQDDKAEIRVEIKHLLKPKKHSKQEMAN